MAIYYICIILIDVILFIDLRKLVYSFLLSKRNIKTAKKIHLSQSKKNRITLAYIKTYTIYVKEFCFFQRLMVINMFLIIPQYILITIVSLYFVNVVLFVNIFFIVLKIMLNIVVRSKFNSKRISKFDKRYKN